MTRFARVSLSLAVASLGLTSCAAPLVAPLLSQSMPTLLLMAQSRPGDGTAAQGNDLGRIAGLLRGNGSGVPAAGADVPR